uniref:Uncharacterized protein n=1 Tax=Lactuca sativa TaxID=4236 RepID=A0A9R1VE35_LACSA|nr:hypothetical protein LSAT_V11C500249560 [Lactuca sativa]
MTRYTYFLAPRKKDINEYDEKVIERRINKFSGFRVYQIYERRYEVTNQMKIGIVNLESRCCTYEKWKLSISCYGSIQRTEISTLNSMGDTVVFPVPVLAEYQQPDEVMVVLPPFMDKRQSWTNNKP